MWEIFGQLAEGKLTVLAEVESGNEGGEARKQFAMNNDNWQKVKGKVKGAKRRKVAVQNDK